MSTTPAVQPELVDADPTPAPKTKALRRRRATALVASAPVDPAVEWLAVLERLASNPAVDITKIKEIVALKEHTDRTAAEAAFNAAYAVMQAELPIIVERGKADRGEKGGGYAYARLEDIVEAVRPIMGRHGFGLRFEHTVEGQTQVCTGILSHAAGHSIRDQFRAAPDSGGNKPPIQANGSTRSYGERYTTRALLGIATKGQDDDGATSQAPDAPDGFDDWFHDLTALADEGWTRLSEAWNVAKGPFKNYVTRHKAAEWNRLKATAQRVDGATRGV